MRWVVGAAVGLHAVQLVPIGLGGSYCTGDTGTPDQHFHPCEPAYHDQQCSVRCADGFKCIEGCPGDVSQGGAGSSVFKCDKHAQWQPWDMYSHHPASWKPTKCVKEVPCASPLMPPFDDYARWEPGSACATGSTTGSDANDTQSLTKVKQPDGTSCASVCARGYYRVAANGSAGDPDDPYGPMVNATCLDGIWTSPLDGKSHMHNALHTTRGPGPCVKDVPCSVATAPKSHTAWHDSSICASSSKLGKDHQWEVVEPSTNCETVCREGFYRASSVAIMNLTCLHGQWAGDVGDCIPGDAYNAQDEMASNMRQTPDGVPTSNATVMASKTLVVAGVVVLALGMMKLGCLCQQRRDKDLLNVAALLSVSTMEPVAGAASRNE
jgi:hypothetical protein